MKHFWIRTAIVGAAAAALAACANTPQFPTREGQDPTTFEAPRPNFPIVEPQPAPAAEGPAPTAQPSTDVESAPLAPLAEAVPPPPPPPPEPAFTTRTVQAVTGRVVDAAGKPVTYEVQPGDGLDAIARKLDTTRAQLAKDNGLEPPYRLRPGQQLKGPAVQGKAYVVTSGDTLYAIARRFGVKAAEIAVVNGFAIDDPIRPNQKIMLPSGFEDSGPITRVITEPSAPPAPPRTVAAAPAQPQPRPPALRPALPATEPAPAARPAPVAATPGPVVAEPRQPPPAKPANPLVATNAPPTDNEVSVAGKGRFVWPVRGETISPFGPKGVGQRNDGLNIRSPAGTAVRSAAAGEVVYAGDQVPGFGNLVLIKHEDGWVTAYAHLSALDVKMRQTVTQGQQIGEVGSTGGVGEAQLHFEIRYAPTPKDKARPIDPALVLPK